MSKNGCLHIFTTIGSNEILSNKQEQLKVRLKLTEGFTSIGRVKEEAKVAFAMTAKMARMQVEMEREELETKRSPIYEFVCREEYSLDVNLMGYLF